MVRRVAHIRSFRLMLVNNCKLFTVTRTEKAQLKLLRLLPQVQLPMSHDTPTGSVTISGTPKEDQVLTAANTLG